MLSVPFVIVTHILTLRKEEEEIMLTYQPESKLCGLACFWLRKPQFNSYKISITVDLSF